MKKQLFILLSWCFVITLFFYFSQYGITKGLLSIKSSFSYKDIAIYFVFSACFSLLYLSKHSVIRLSSYIFTYIAFVVFICYLQVTSLGGTFNSGLGFEVSDANLLLIEASRSGAFKDVLLTYWITILIGLVKSFMLVFIVYISSSLIKLKISNAFISVCPIIVLSTIYYLIGSGSAVDKMPIVTKVPMQIAFAKKLDVYRGERNEVKLSLIRKEKRFPIVIYIVDESIRGDLLGFNGYKTNTTPFLSSYSGTFINYGVGVSSGNCSATSNIFLQTGVQPRKDTLSNIGYELFSQPSIFQYAKKAGYRTVYVDGQLKGTSLQNYMSTQDFTYIDSYIQIRSKYDNPKRYSIDMHISDEVAKQVNSNTPTFIYVQKSGSHFPIGLTYPESEQYFLPVANSGTENNHNGLLNSYYNSLRWNVDKFFEKLLKQIGNSDTLIFYTSDHSINIFDNGNTTGYCSSSVFPSEVKVPISLFATGKSSNFVLTMAMPYLNDNRNRMSHFRLFPTLLEIMGYTSSGVKNMYGPTLFDAQTGADELFSIGNLCPGRDTAKIVRYSEN